jgi:ACT domain-containing protein
MSTSDDLLRRVARAVAQRLPEAPPGVVEAVVSEVLGAVAPSSGMSASSSSLAAPFQSSGDGYCVDQLARAATVDVDHCALCRAHEARSRSRAVCTTTGRNGPGMVATVTRVIAESGGDIVDIAQTLVGDYFTMIIVMDTSGLERTGATFADLKDRLIEASNALGVHSVVMREDVMNALQRV